MGLAVETWGGLEVVLSRYPSGNASEWKPEKWAVLDEFQRRYLAIMPSEAEALDDVLCMFARSGWSLNALHEQVLALPDDHLVPRLWRDWNGGRTLKIWMTTFWEPPQDQAMRQFYVSDQLAARVKKLAFAEDDDPAITSKALDLVQAIEEARHG